MIILLVRLFLSGSKRVMGTGKYLKITLRQGFPPTAAKICSTNKSTSLGDSISFELARIQQLHRRNEKATDFVMSYPEGFDTSGGRKLNIGRPKGR
jgi:hypothetical protein